MRLSGIRGAGHWVVAWTLIFALSGCVLSPVRRSQQQLVVPVASETIRVVATGHVVKRGTYILPKDSTVTHLLEAAGGSTPSGLVREGSHRVMILSAGSEQAQSGGKYVDRSLWSEAVLRQDDIVVFLENPR